MGQQPQGPLAKLWDEGPVAGMTDGQLLDRFATRRGDAAEAAFAALVARHGPMVARVCRGRLRDEHDVEDAFQATFLVLVRRAHALGERDLLAPWLYGVAHRVARKARAVAARRRGREGGPAGFDPPARPDPAAEVRVELAPILREEVDRLPARYRQPVILCHLQGLTHAQAADELAWPVGTVSVRLARARKILADRLARRGVTASVAAVAATLAAEASAAAPLAPAWIQSTAVAAAAAATGLSLAAATAAVSAGAAHLARRTTMPLLLSSWKWLAVPAAVALTAAAGDALIRPPGGRPGSPPGPRAAQRVDPARTAAAAAPAGDPFTRVDFLGPVTNYGERAGKATFGADNIVVWGKFGDLDRAIGQLHAANPNATFRLQLSDGSFQIQRPATTPAPAPADPVMAQGGAPAGGGDAFFKELIARQQQQVAPEQVVYSGLRDVADLSRMLEQVRRDAPQSIHEVEFANGTIQLRSRYLKGDAPRPAPPVAAGNSGPDLVATATAEPSPKPMEAAGDAMPAAVPAPPPIVLPSGQRLVADADGRFDLGMPPPAGYFDLPAADPGRPGSPRPVRVGQVLDVEVLEALPGRPITGERVVRQDGTISLGFYGDLHVAGLNRDQIKVKLLEKLRHELSDSTLGLFGFHDDRIVAIPPVESNRLFVDDQPGTAPAGVGVGARKPDEPRTAPAAPGGPTTGAAPVRAGQKLVIEVLEALPGRPITGERVVRPDGTVGLGFYGDVAVAGLTRDQVKVQVVEHLRKYLGDDILGLRATDPATHQVRTIAPARSDRVFVADDVDFDRSTATEPAADGKVRAGQVVAVEVLQALPGRPITGERVVQPDGTLNLGFYGPIPVVGLTRGEIKARVIEALRGTLTDEQLGLVREVDGKSQPVAPADSTCVFVDDAIPRPAPRAAASVDKLGEQVADLTSKLDAALGAIERLRRERNHDPMGMPAGPKAPGTP